MIVKVHRKVKVHKVPRTVADRRRKQELHRMVDELDDGFYNDIKRHLKTLKDLSVIE